MKWTVVQNNSWPFLALLAKSPLFLHLLLDFLGEGDDTPLQYSCLENPMDGGAWWAVVHGVAKGQTQLNNFTFTGHPGLEIKTLDYCTLYSTVS